MFRSLLIIMFLVFASCSSTKVSKNKETNEKTEQLQDTVISKIDSQSINSSLNVVSNEAMSAALISALNLRYSGKKNDDKLILDLQRTIDGMRLEVQGTGEANYSQSDSVQINLLRTELYTRQDSLHSVEMAAIQNLNHTLSSFLKEKEVDRQNKGFDFMFWLVLGLISVTFILFIVKPQIPFKT